MTRGRAVSDILDTASGTELPKPEPVVLPVPEPEPVVVTAPAEEAPALETNGQQILSKPVMCRFDFMMDTDMRQGVKDEAHRADTETRGPAGKGPELRSAAFVRAAVAEALTDPKLGAKVRRRAGEEWKAAMAELRKSGKGA